MASETQAIQDITNKLIELRAQLKETTAEMEKLQNAINTSAYGKDQNMANAFLESQKRGIKELQIEVERLDKQWQTLFTSKLRQLPQLPGPSGQAVDVTSQQKRQAAIDKRRAALKRESDASNISVEGLPANYIESWNQIGRAIPQAAQALRGFLDTNKIAFTDLQKISLDENTGFAQFSGQIERAQGAVETFSYILDSETGLRKYSGQIEYTNGITEKFTKVTDASGKSVNKSMKDGFDPKAFDDYGKQAKKLLETIDRLKFSTEDLKDVQEEASTGIRRYTLAKRDDEGVMRRATITTDKWGNILQDTQKRFRGFFSTIARNTAEVLKWTVAVQLTYKPLMKMYELVEIMIENEAKLADITIALGESYESLNDIFKISADVAEQTGSSIKGVLEGYELAYRATGGIPDNVERANTAQQLLIDSMILSKVSTLDQATALDTLAGGLLQIKEPLDSGQQLLDKWVAVSKRANVSIATLAESFAITASSAEGAGLSLDELNGIIAVVAENTTLSATEAGNAVRAFISGFQTDTAVRELSRFGVLVKTSGQESLDFLDVMYQVRNLFDKELISQSQLNEIAEAIGGGARRGAQVVAFLKNLERVQEVATVSSLAQGDAQEALAIKMETLKTKSTQLENAFVKLGQSLGTEGGLLDGAKIALDVMTKMVNVVSKLTDALGTGVPVLVAYAVAMSQINKVGGISAFGGIASNALLGMQTGGGGVEYKGDFATFSKAMNETVGLDKIRNKTLGNMAAYLKTSAGMGRAIGGIGVGLQAAGSFASGDTERGVGNLIGGAAALAMSSSPMMAIAGSAIGGAFVDYVYGQESEFKDLFAGVLDPTEKPESELSEIEKLQKKQQDLVDSMVDSVHPIRLAWTQAFSAIQAFVAPKRGQELTHVQAALVTLNRASRDEELDNYYAQINKLSEHEKVLAGEIIKSLPIYDERNKLIKENKPLIDSLVQSYRDLAFEERLAGDITNKQFNDINKILSSLGTSAGGYVAAFGNEFIKLNKDVNNTAEAFENIALALTHGNEADISYLLSLLTDIAEAQYNIKEGGDLVANQSIISDREVKGAKAISMILKDIQKSSYKTPTIIEALGLSNKELALVIKNAEAARDARNKALFDLGLIDKTYTQNEFENIFDPIMLDVGRSGAEQLILGLSEADFKGAMDDLVDAGKVTLEEGFGFMDFSDISAEQLKSMAAESLRLSSMLDIATGGGIDFDFKTFAAIVDGQIIGPITAEMTILQMLAKELIDVNEEQVEGIYNLPSDGSFYVPFEGYAKGFGGGGGGGLQDIIKALEVFASQFPQPEKDMGEPLPLVQEVTPEGLISGYVPEKTLEDYFGPMPGTDPYEPLRSYDVEAIQTIEPEQLEKSDQLIDGEIGSKFYAGVEAFGLAADKIAEWINKLFGKEEEALQSGGGAGGAEIYDAIKGLNLEQIFAYVSSGQFAEDAMINAPSTGEQYDKVVEGLQNLSKFNFYEVGEEIASSIGNFFKGLFGEEEVLQSGGGSGGVLKSTVAPAPDAGILEALNAILSMNSFDDVYAYFNSGGFHDDMMKGSADPGEVFHKLLKIFEGLELFNLYDEGEEGGILSNIAEAIRSLFTGGEDNTVGPTSYMNDSISDLVTATQQLNETGQLQLALEINSDTKLTLDSQIISTVVKNFVYEEMLKRESAMSASTTKTFQI